MQLMLARTYVAIGALQRIGDEDVSRCFATQFAHKFTLEQISDPNLGADDMKFQQRIRDMFKLCTAAR